MLCDSLNGASDELCCFVLFVLNRNYTRRWNNGEI